MKLLKTVALAAFLSAGMVYGGDNTTPLRIVPNSTSPNGKTSLYYRMTNPSGEDPKPQFFFSNTSHLTEIKNLSNRSPNSLQSGYYNEHNPRIEDPHFEDKILLGEIAFNDDSRLKGEEVDGAFCYYVNWSPDSHWVSIDGGAHKFSHVIAYDWDGSTCTQLKLPLQIDFKKYCDDELPTRSIQDLGIEKRVQKHFIESSYALWVNNGVLAYSTFPTLLAGVTPSYFLINCAAKPKATIEGFVK